MPIEVQPTLSDVLTLAGAAVSAVLVTTFVQLLKGTPLGALITGREWEQSLVLLVAGLLVIVASIDRHNAAHVTTLNDVFVSVVAWLSISKLSTGIYDEAARKPGAFTETVVPAT